MSNGPGYDDPPSPGRSGAMTRRPVAASAGPTSRHTDEVCGEPCRSSTGVPSPEPHSRTRKSVSSTATLRTFMRSSLVEDLLHDHPGPPGHAPEVVEELALGTRRVAKRPSDAGQVGTARREG